MKAREGRSAIRRIQRTLMRQINHRARAALLPRLPCSGASACTRARAHVGLGEENQCKQAPCGARLPRRMGLFM